MRFRDRSEAGRELADQVLPRLARLLPESQAGQAESQAGQADSQAGQGLQVLALPRGGVPVGRPIADRLGTRLSVLLVRKLGVPGHQELAMGAIAAIGDQIRTVRNAEILRQIRIPDDHWQRVWDTEAEELRRRMDRFGSWTARAPDGPVILVDDGMATGATMQAAVAAVRAAAGDQPQLIMVAVPVAARAAIDALTADEVSVVCLSQPTPLLAIGESYRDFHQLGDEEVVAILSD